MFGCFNTLRCGQVLIGFDKLAPPLANYPFLQISPHFIPSQTSHLLHRSINPKLQMPIIPREIILEDWSLAQIITATIVAGVFSALLLFVFVIGYIRGEQEVIHYLERRED
jgi:hypothetical protein